MNWVPAKDIFNKNVARGPFFFGSSNEVEFYTPVLDWNWNDNGIKKV